MTPAERMKAYTKKSKGPNAVDAAKATGSYITDEMLGFDDFGWVGKNLQQGNWGEAAKSLGAGLLELGLTVGGFFTGGASTAGGAALKAGGKAVIKEGLEQTGKGVAKEATERGAGATVRREAIRPSSYDDVSRSAQNSARGNLPSTSGKTFDPSSIRASESIRPTGTGYSPTATLTKTKPAPAIQPLRIKPLEPKTKPLTDVKPIKEVLPKASPKEVEVTSLVPKRVIQPGGLLGLQMLGQQLPEPNYQNNPATVTQTQPEPESNNRKRTATETTPRRYRQGGSMGTAAADVTIPYAY